MKRNAHLAFDDGSISMKVSGYDPAKIGSAELSFREDVLGWSDCNHYRTAQVARSEAVEIRDWLNEWLTEAGVPIRAGHRDEQLRIQALGAALSRRDWHAVERAYETIRDEFDRRKTSAGASMTLTGNDSKGGAE